MRLFKFIIIPAVLFLLPWFASPLHAQWEPEQRLTFEPDTSWLSYNNARCLAVSGDTVHVVWFDHRAGNWEVYYKRSTDAGIAWGPDVRLTMDSASSQNPSIAVSGSTVHLVWQDDRNGYWKIHYRRSTDQGGSWEGDTILTITGETPSLAASDSFLHLVWSDARNGDNKIFYKRSTNSGTTWSLDTNLTSLNPGVHSFPCISASEAGLHLVYVSSDSSGSIMYKRSTNQGQTWTQDTALSLGHRPPYIIANSYPSIFAIGNRVYLVWCYRWLYMTQAGSDINYKVSRDGGSSWNSRTLMGYAAWYEPRPAVNVSGLNVHMVWHNPINNVYYLHSGDDGASWDPEIRLTSDSSAISVSPFIDVQNTVVHVVWTDNRDGNYELYYKRNPTGNGVDEIGGSRQMSFSSIKATPNPFASFTKTPGHEAEQFALYDIAGRRVGTYKGERIGMDLRPGVYFIRALDGKAGLTRIVKVR